MLSDEEKEKIELEFQYALDNIVSKIKGETATAIVHSEQSMILLFKRLMLKIEKQSKEIEELKAKIDVTNWQEMSCKDIIEAKYISKDKIKAKIEEYQNKIDKMYTKKLWNEPIDTINKNRYVNYVNILQSLLEKE